jgi:hypothetical protein
VFVIVTEEGSVKTTNTGPWGVYMYFYSVLCSLNFDESYC